MHRSGRLFPLLAALTALALPTAGFASTFTVDQCATCGPTGGQALQIITSGITAPATTAVILINTSGAGINPSTVGSISASVMKDATVSEPTPFEDQFSSGFRPAVEQDGNIYVLNPAIAGPIYGSFTTPATSFTSGWGTISASGLTLSEFDLFSFSTGTINTSSTPNLTGDNIFFGIGSIATFNNSVIVNATGETDFAGLSISDGPLLTDNTFSDLSNYQVFEYPGTPEPSSLLLLGTGLTGLCFRIRRRRTA